MQITKWGRRRVASEDFKKCLFHITFQLWERRQTEEEVACALRVYTAANLCTNKRGEVQLTPELINDFINANFEQVNAIVGDFMCELIAVGVATGQIPEGTLPKQEFVA